MTATTDLDFTVSIAARESLTDSVVRFELTPPAGTELPPAEAGAHIQVRVPNGELRKYSLCQGPDITDRYVIAVKREDEGKGGSKSLIDESKVGDVLSISAPVNDFPLSGNPTRYIFIAGGIGITPIYAMIQTLMQTGGKPFKLYYLTRFPEQTPFLDELSAPEYHGKVKIHHTHGDPDQAFDLWPILEQPKGAHVYCCGPRRLMEEVRDMTGHWSGSSVHFEDFGSSDAAHLAGDTPFTVRLHGCDGEIEVGADQSILEALEAQGYKVPSSCESGTCGTCRCSLIDGDVDHRDLVLTEEEQERYLMVCVSRAARNNLVIELPS